LTLNGSASETLYANVYSGTSTTTEISDAYLINGGTTAPLQMVYNVSQAAKATINISARNRGSSNTFTGNEYLSC
jgi:hypothetical protein